MLNLVAYQDSSSDFSVKVENEIRVKHTFQRVYCFQFLLLVAAIKM